MNATSQNGPANDSRIAPVDRPVLSRARARLGVRRARVGGTRRFRTHGRRFHVQQQTRSGIMNRRNTGLSPQSPTGSQGRKSFSLSPRERVGVGGKCAPFLTTALSLILLLSSVTAAFSQRTFNLAITGTNNGVAISWTAQSATPIGDLFIIPQFLVEHSADLRSWTAISSNLTGTLSQKLTFVDTNADHAFYRVQSIIDEEYAQLTGVPLDFGGLTGADFFGAELFGASLQQASLNGAIFAGADLREADFNGSDLTGANLFAAFASSAIFDNSTMTGADCSFGIFESGSFFNVDLTGVDFSSATLDGCDFDFTFLKNVKLDANTIIDPKPLLIWQIVNQGASNEVLTGVDLSFGVFIGVSFNGANLSGSELAGAVLQNTDLRHANFTGADMSFVDFRGAQMDSTTIIDSKSRLVWQILNQNAGAGADLHGVDLSNTELLGANFIGANLTNTICTSIICETANFGKANLTRANCSSGDFFAVTLTNANLTLANFSSADFTDADLLNATTNGANFTGATFSNTIMPDGSIRNF